MICGIMLLKRKTERNCTMAGKAVYIVTNNPMVYEKYNNDGPIGVDFMEGASYLDVLMNVRNKVQSRWRLISHPQASNLKPTESPFKSIVVTDRFEVYDYLKEVELIEQAIFGYEKLTAGTTKPVWKEHYFRDYQLIDLDTMESVFSSAVLKNLIMNHS